MFLPNVIVRLITQYLPEREILDWIDEKKLSGEGLMRNPGARHIIEETIFDNSAGFRLDWFNISGNPAAIYVIYKMLDDPRRCHRIYTNKLSGNPAAIRWIEYALQQAPHLICWELLSANPAAIHIIKKILADPESKHRINPHQLVMNEAATDLIKEMFPDGPWDGVVLGNPAVFRIIEPLSVAEFEKLSPHGKKLISGNPAAIRLVEDVMKTPRTRHLIDMSYLMLNPAAMHLIKAEMRSGRCNSYYYWCLLSRNPSIFYTVDTAAIARILLDLDW